MTIWYHRLYNDCDNRPELGIGAVRILVIVLGNYSVLLIALIYIYISCWTSLHGFVDVSGVASIDVL